VITKNEEEGIRRCLESVRWADEIVVVDSGSTDGTEKICREFTDRFIYHEWPGSNRQKQFAMEQCSNLWVLSIDADEVVSPSLRASIESLLAGGPKCSGYKMLRRNYYKDKPLYHGAMVPKPELRLFRRDKARFIDRLIHDKVILDGPCGKVGGYLEHYNITDLYEWIEKNTLYARRGAEDDFARGKRIGFRHFVGVLNLFLRRYVLLGGFLHGVSGIVFSVMPAYFRLLHYCIMWEMQKEAGGGREPKSGKS
jgi:glycosyltransferase involved in cell wall biosynthesis